MFDCLLLAAYPLRLSSLFSVELGVVLALQCLFCVRVAKWAKTVKAITYSRLVPILDEMYQTKVSPFRRMHGVIYPYIFVCYLSFGFFDNFLFLFLFLFSPIFNIYVLFIFASILSVDPMFVLSCNFNLSIFLHVHSLNIFDGITRENLVNFSTLQNHCYFFFASITLVGHQQFSIAREALVYLQ